MKIRSIVIILIFSIAVFCCNNNVEQSYYDNGQLEYKVNVKNGNRHGELLKYYKNGQLKYISNWRKGLKQGRSELFFMNGQLNVSENYKDNLPHGEIKEYDSLGTILRIMRFVHGVKNKENQFYLSGKLKGSIDIRNDTIFAYYYYENGIIEEVSVKNNNKLIYGATYDLNAKPIKSYLPIKSRHQITSDSTFLELKIVYSECKSCSYLIIVGELNEKGKLVNESFRNEYKVKDIKIELKNEKFKSSVIGLVYEIDENKKVLAFSPFTSKSK